jgi:beta-glucanase (GH16 family)
VLGAATAIAAAALLLLPAIAALSGCEHETETEPLEWGLVWSDEFEGPAGQLPDASKWAFDIGTDWGNDQLEYDTNRPENVSLDGDGNLAITAREESYEGQDYTSGRIKTAGLFAREEGRFEARIKLPVGQGLWPAFWMLGNNIGSVGWPECGEIDIMEYRGQEPNIVHGSLHGPGYSGGAALTGSFARSGAGFDADFHVFTIDWDDDGITWLVDGIAYQTFTPASLSSGRRWVYDHSFFILLNVAVGGNYVGPPNGSTVFPQTMLVDWVRVYGFTSGS